jgi:hypothetical protein
MLLLPKAAFQVHGHDVHHLLVWLPERVSLHVALGAPDRLGFSGLIFSEKD